MFVSKVSCSRPTAGLESPGHLLAASLLVAAGLVGSAAVMGAWDSPLGAALVLGLAILPTPFVLEGTWRPERDLLLAILTMLTVLFLPFALWLEGDATVHLGAVGACTGTLLVVTASRPRPRSHAVTAITTLILSVALIVASLI